MSEETLLSAARRLVRFFNIDEQQGGLTSTETLIARDTLVKQIKAEEARQKALAVPEGRELEAASA